jgi:hypothetical protein
MHIKKTSWALGLLGLAAASASAEIVVTEFNPDSPSINNLNHDYAYSWGINSAPIAGHTILAATLTIENIRDWIVEPDDALYITLLDTAPLGVQQAGVDGQAGTDGNGTGDFFAGLGVALVTFNDLLPYTQEELNSGASVDLSYDFTADQVLALQTYANSGGRFAIGFDPDCHYYNDGVKLTVTSSVPEPGTLALMGLGILGMALVARRKSLI